jgi:hypothetical protein
VYLFRRVFRDGAIMERINFRDGIVGNVKKHAVPSVLPPIFIKGFNHMGWLKTC